MVSRDPKSSLGSVKVEEFWGDRSRYLKWKKTIQAQQCLYGLESQELAMLVYLSTRREARDVVEQRPVTSYTGSGGLHLLWKVLDEAFGETEAELFERVDKELERYRRAPGETIPHYLAEMRRLKAQYSRVDPDTKLSDRAWGQKLLHKASLSRKERHDVFYSAGACYDPAAIEKALRIRCSKGHEDEKRTTRPPREREKEDDHHRSTTYKKKKIFIKKRVHGTHIAEADEQEEDEEAEDQEMEEQPGEEPGAEEGEDEDNETSEGEMEEGDLKEAFAAGWKAKQKVAEHKKNRGWKPMEKKGEKPPIDARKKATTCSSCGKQGHWRGDAECANVISGRDAPHKRATAAHYTYMVGGKERQCLQCYWPALDTAKFCGECGCSLPGDERMTSVAKQKRDEEWDVVGEIQEVQITLPKHRMAEMGAASKAKAKEKSSPPPGHVQLKGREVMAALPNMTKEEKRALHQALRKDADEEANKEAERRKELWKSTVEEYGYGLAGMGVYEPSQRTLHPDEPWRSSVWRQMEGPEAVAKAMAASSSSGYQAPVPPSSKADKPKPVKEKEQYEFRRSLYEAQVQYGRCVPSV